MSRERGPLGATARMAQRSVSAPVSGGSVSAWTLNRAAAIATFALAATVLPTTAAAQTPDPFDTDAHEKPLPGWTGPVFKLSNAYPATKPTGLSKPWKTIDFKTKPAEYLNAVLKYCYEGNIAVEWRGQDNTVRKWYHAPWMHPTFKGREFVHGMTRERSARIHRLHANQDTQLGAYAVGMYNELGGWAIGRVWADHESPDPSQARFPEGTVAVKLLFVEVPEKREGNSALPPAQHLDNQVPYLANSFEWDAYVSKDGNFATTPRAKGRVRLIQIDVAVKDDRAKSTSGWVFGTFNYNKDAPGATPWDRMIPVGLMWGNDPTLKPQNYRSGTRPKQSKVIAANVMTNTATDWKGVGWLERMNGPIDNPASSCLSCHETAEWPKAPSMFSSVLTWQQVTNPAFVLEPTVVAQKMRFFRNIKGDPYDATSISLDYSQQLQDGLENWCSSTGCNNR